MSDESEKLPEGTLISHLLELRTRLMWASSSVLLAFIPTYWFHNQLFEFLERPLLAKLPKGATLIATNVTDAFTTPLKLAFVVALLIAMPVALYQIWLFVAPGLYRREKRFALPLLISSVVLFYCGAAFAYWLVFPVMFNFFIGALPRGVSMMADITRYMDSALTLMLAFGLAFEVPVAVVLLVLTGIISVDKLAKSRGYVVIGIFIVAAILTPPDAISQTIMALPMWLLFEGGIIFARIMTKQPDEQTSDKTI
jgi:sec-independent protein translocase protein TatC